MASNVFSFLPEIMQRVPIASPIPVPHLLNLILNFIHRCPGMTSGFDSQLCKVQNVRLITQPL